VRAPLTVESCQDDAAWNAYVEAHRDACGYHLWQWRGIFTGVFGHEAHYAAARRDGRIVGVLPLVRFASPLFGRFVVSLPFVNYGGVLADDAAAADALVAYAGTYTRRCGATHLELRHDGRRFPALAPKEHKVAMTLALPADADTLWAALDRKVRNQVRKAEKSALTTEVGGRELAANFYHVFCRNMRDLGTPVYSTPSLIVLGSSSCGTRARRWRPASRGATVLGPRCRGRRRCASSTPCLPTTCSTGRS
jgi:FemAB-related protein (PEP-CTERM system-associated)